MSDCIFCKIINGSIPVEKLYEDENMIVISDLYPQADVHLLMIPKEHYECVSKMTIQDAQILGLCIKKFADFAVESGINDFRLINNCGKSAGQSIFHMHVHLLAGKGLSEKIV